jgi:sulfite reductase beta subunit-like hemoprotein
MTTCAPALRTGHDRCPGVVRLHAAADGGLARVRVPGGLLAAPAVAALGRAAGLGSGLVELTGRANVQVRGLPEGAAAPLADVLRDAGMLPSVAHERVRNVLASPLAGRSADALCGTDAVVRALDRGLCADPSLSALPGRFLFAVDDASGLALSRPADVTLVAEGPASFRLWVGDVVTDVVAAGAHAAARAALGAAHAFLDVRGTRGAWRMAELDGGAAAVADRMGVAVVGPAPRAATTGIEPGVALQYDGGFAVTALAPLGRLDGAVLDGLVELGVDLRVSPWRTLTVVDRPARSDALALADSLSALGLVVGAGSGWAGLSACAGLGACANATLDVRAAAAARAAVRAPGAPAEHWSACERRCGEPRGVGVGVTARGDGGLLVACAGERDQIVADVPAALAELGR